MTKLLLVDGNALFYRAYHAFPKLTTKTGEQIGATYGFARILFGAIKQLQPTHVAICFDPPGGTFRDDMYDQYKATRASMPEDLASQIPRIHELSEKLEAPIYTVKNFEADDVLATIATQATKQDHELTAIILSGDQDLLQLVTDRISVFMPAVAPKTPTIFTPEEVLKKYGFEPIRMIDYKGLRGDPSDNIPGVPGIGEVSAKKLLSEFTSIDNLYCELSAGGAPSVKGALREKLITGEDSARLSYKLATVVHDAPVTYSAEDCRWELKHPEVLAALFNELGFKSLLNELPGEHKVAAAAHDVFEVDTTPGELSESEKTDEILAPILRSMEDIGVKIDKDYLKKLETEFDGEIASLADKVYELAGQPFNLDSPGQVAHILYEILHIPTQWIRKGKTGFTTDAATLEGLAKDYPICTLILNYREVTKLQSTYIRPLQQMTDEHDRLHTSYAPDTATGRISSRNPNLQNIPVRSEQGKRIRKAFIPDKGYVFVAADYSQMELRIAAHLSGDKDMIEAFKSGRDFHTETAERMGVDRSTAKMINFSILYGKGAYGFSQDLGITVDEAKKYIETYFATYKGLRAYLDKTLEDGKRDGYVSTMFGRKRYLPDLTASNFQRRSAAEREALNMPIQGTQADILKLAMVALAPRLKKELPNVRLILTVHDELVMEVLESEKVAAAKLLQECMLEQAKLTVPVAVQLKAGKNWAEVEEFSL